MHVSRTLRWEAAGIPIALLLLWAVFSNAPLGTVMATVFALAVLAWLLTGFMPPRHAPRR